MATASKHERPGYVRNAYGSFDHAQTRTRVLLLYRELVNDYPGDDEVRFLQAGALGRACDFEAAASAYAQLISGGGRYSQLSRERLIGIYWYNGNRAQAQIVLNEFNAISADAGSEPLPLLVEQILGGSQLRPD